MTIATGIAIVYGIDIQGTVNGTTEDLSDFAKVTYNMFQHLAWGLAMSWLIFACHHGYGGNIFENILIPKEITASLK